MINWVGVIFLFATPPIDLIPHPSFQLSIKKPASFPTPLTFTPPPSKKKHKKHQGNTGKRDKY